MIFKLDGIGIRPAKQVCNVRLILGKNIFWATYYKSSQKTGNKIAILRQIMPNMSVNMEKLD